MKKVRILMFLFAAIVLFSQTNANAIGIWHEKIGEDYIHIQDFPVYGFGMPCIRILFSCWEGSTVFYNEISEDWDTIPIISIGLVGPIDQLIRVPENAEKPVFFFWGYAFPKIIDIGKDLADGELSDPWSLIPGYNIGYYIWQDVVPDDNGTDNCTTTTTTTIIPTTTTTITAECTHNDIDDVLIKDIEYLGKNTYRIYLDVSSLPTPDKKEYVAQGQETSDPDHQDWKDIAVIKNGSCFYFDKAWKSDTSIFEFSYRVIRNDGSETWIDPAGSKFQFNGHLGIRLGNYKN